MLFCVPFFKNNVLLWNFLTFKVEKAGCIHSFMHAGKAISGKAMARMALGVAFPPGF